MYFIDLSLRNVEQGYVDSVALVADVIGAQELYALAREAEDVMLADRDDALDLFQDIVRDAENIAGDHDFAAFAYEGVYYVMTHAEFEEWDGEN